MPLPEHIEVPFQGCILTLTREEYLAAVKRGRASKRARGITESGLQRQECRRRSRGKLRRGCTTRRGGLVREQIDYQQWGDQRSTRIDIAENSPETV